MTTLAFTGTREGMTEAQKRTVVVLLERLKPSVVRHGDCVGADADFHAIVRSHLPATRIIIHPPDNNSLRAFCRGDETRSPLPYLVRNQEMVLGSNWVLGVPKESAYQSRGGTWYTIAKGMKELLRVWVCWPDGGYWQWDNHEWVEKVAAQLPRQCP